MARSHSESFIWRRPNAVPLSSSLYSPSVLLPDFALPLDLDPLLLGDASVSEIAGDFDFLGLDSFLGLGDLLGGISSSDMETVVAAVTVEFDRCENTA